MNLSAWIDLQGIFVELPIMVLLTPEGWALPSLINLSISIANIVPLLLVLLRWHQGSRFSEIPYIYIIILVGAISCGGLALFWQKTIFFFGSQRIFFDYMKRFQSKYLTAVFLGEGLTAAIPTLLALAQGSMGDPICIENINSTGVQPVDEDNFNGWCCRKKCILPLLKKMFSTEILATIIDEVFVASQAKLR
ncbi:unnamed protein product [Rotaria magnacalcarata]